MKYSDGRVNINLVVCGEEGRTVSSRPNRADGRKCLRRQRRGELSGMDGLLAKGETRQQDREISTRKGKVIVDTQTMTNSGIRDGILKAPSGVESALVSKDG